MSEEKALTGLWREAYLSNLAETGLKIASGRRAGVTVNAVDAALRKDPEFRKLHELALAVYREYLEKKLQERAVDGLEEEVFNKDGEKTGTRKKFSDRLFEMLIKRHCPEYREKLQVDHHVSGGVLILGATSKDSKGWLEEHGGKTLDGNAEPV